MRWHVPPSRATPRPHGRPVSLVGWSLGGIFARELARDRPVDGPPGDHAGAPFRFRDGDRGNASALYDTIGPGSTRSPAHPPEHERPRCRCRYVDLHPYRRDRPLAHVHRGGRPAARTSRCARPTPGSGYNMLAAIAVADRLAQPVGAWRPFRPPLALRPWFPGRPRGAIDMRRPCRLASPDDRRDPGHRGPPRRRTGDRSHRCAARSTWRRSANRRGDGRRRRPSGWRSRSSVTSSLASLGSGARLPLEADMATQYDVSRSSLREALRILEVQGLIRLKPGPGGGPVVGVVEAANLARTASLYFHLAGASYRDLVDTQALLEPLCAVAASPNTERRERMTPYLVPAPIDDLDRYHRETVSFHGGSTSSQPTPSSVCSPKRSPRWSPATSRVPIRSSCTPHRRRARRDRRRCGRR